VGLKGGQKPSPTEEETLDRQPDPINFSKPFIRRQAPRQQDPQATPPAEPAEASRRGPSPGSF